jgi:hypothetical protein
LSRRKSNFSSGSPIAGRSDLSIVAIESGCTAYIKVNDLDILLSPSLGEGLGVRVSCMTFENWDNKNTVHTEKLLTRCNASFLELTNKKFFQRSPR